MHPWLWCKTHPWLLFGICCVYGIVQLLRTIQIIDKKQQRNEQSNDLGDGTSRYDYCVEE